MPNPKASGYIGPIEFYTYNIINFVYERRRIAVKRASVLGRLRKTFEKRALNFILQMKIRYIFSHHKHSLFAIFNNSQI